MQSLSQASGSLKKHCKIRHCLRAISGRYRCAGLSKPTVWGVTDGVSDGHVMRLPVQQLLTGGARFLSAAQLVTGIFLSHISGAAAFTCY